MKIRNVANWIVASLFLLFALGSFSGSGILSTIFALLAAFLFSPPLSEFVKIILPKKPLVSAFAKTGLAVFLFLAMVISFPSSVKDKPVNAPQESQVVAEGKSADAPKTMTENDNSVTALQDSQAVAESSKKENYTQKKESEAKDFEKLYQKGLKYFNKFKYEKAEKQFVKLGAYKDSEDLLAKIHKAQEDFKQVTELFNAGQYEKSHKLLHALGMYKRSDARRFEVKIIHDFFEKGQFQIVEKLCNNLLCPECSKDECLIANSGLLNNGIDKEFDDLWSESGEIEYKLLWPLFKDENPGEDEFERKDFEKKRTDLAQKTRKYYFAFAFATKMSEYNFNSKSYMFTWNWPLNYPFLDLAPKTLQKVKWRFSRDDPRGYRWKETPEKTTIPVRESYAKDLKQFLEKTYVQYLFSIGQCQKHKYFDPGEVKENKRLGMEYDVDTGAGNFCRMNVVGARIAIEYNKKYYTLKTLVPVKTTQISKLHGKVTEE